MSPQITCSNRRIVHEKSLAHTGFVSYVQDGEIGPAGTSAPAAQRRGDLVSSSAPSARRNPYREDAGAGRRPLLVRFCRR